MSAAPATNKAASDSGIQVDKPKTMVASPNTATATEHFRADLGLQRPEGKIEGGDRGARGRRRGELRQAGGSDLEYVAGVDREQRRRPGQKNREQVEGDRSQDQLVVPHVANALDGLAQGMAAPIDRAALTPLISDRKASAATNRAALAI
jgi:hypothetical protein